MRDRQRLLARLEDSWQALQASYEDLPDQALLQAGAAGGWSVRDILTHVTTWEAEFLSVLPLLVRGERLPRYGGIDAFNRRQQEAKRDLSLAEVRGQLEETHERLLSALRELGEMAPADERRMRHRLRLDTSAHYREHTGQIAAWREARGD